MVVHCCGDERGEALHAREHRRPVVRVKVPAGRDDGLEALQAHRWLQQGPLARGRDHECHLEPVDAGEGGLPVRELPEEDAKGVDVAELVEADRHLLLCALKHLRGHVPQRANGTGAAVKLGRGQLQEGLG